MLLITITPQSERHADVPYLSPRILTKKPESLDLIGVLKRPVSRMHLAVYLRVPSLLDFAEPLLYTLSDLILAPVE